MASSTGKYHPSSPSYSGCNNYSSLNTTSLNDEEKEKLRKKQSLKDILKNKRQKSGYKMEKTDSKVDKYESLNYYGK